ncbi:MAG TPA: hypothetical protein VJK51_03255 [Candidatus Nanoarchaeia archaeon]|nr:hypothetical protein [Candidatus Nanoarchaeia archaeon]
MLKEDVKQFKKKVREYKKEDIIFGKSLEILLSRIKAAKEQVETEIMSCNHLILVEKQVKDNEIRYGLFFIYGRKKGRKYVITFRDNKIRIITVFPLGRKTLKKYRNKGLNTEIT